MINIKDFSIPQTAGCYIFKDDRDQIIYVGKSKFLPKRVSSYFQKNHKDAKTLKLVTEIKNADFISTESENEALVLEEDLIKLYKPKFNIKGKDDRTIRSKLVITNEAWSRIELYYPHDEFEGEVICEFTSGKVAREILTLVYDLFQLPSCSYNLSDENIKSGKFKTCLEWHMGRCQAPCVGLAKKLDHMFNIKLIKDIFQFNFKTTKKHFYSKMKFHSSKLEFERANDWKTKINLLKRLESSLKPIELRNNRRRCVDLGKTLNLKFTPTIIDAFDNSHTQGIEAVCGLVRFSLLQPDKSGYRKFIIKSGVGGDDYSSFEEVLLRRFKRLLEEGQNLPNLVIIDGARPQLNIGINVLRKLGIEERVDIISISKDAKHKPKTIHLSSGKDIPIKGFIEFSKIIEEVHRFAISFHQQRISKRLFK